MVYTEEMIKVHVLFQSFSLFVCIVSFCSFVSAIFAIYIATSNNGPKERNKKFHTFIDCTKFICNYWFIFFIEYFFLFALYYFAVLSSISTVCKHFFLHIVALILLNTMCTHTVLMCFALYIVYYPCPSICSSVLVSNQKQ